MSHLTAEYLKNLYVKYGELKVLDDILQFRSADSPPSKILGYPRTEDSVDDYEHFTGAQLDQFVDIAAKHYISLGLKPNVRGTVALLAPSNVDFIVSFFALSRLGYTVLCLSLRIAPVAIINLLKQCECTTVVHGRTPQIESSVKDVNKDFPISSFPIPMRATYDRPLAEGEQRFVREFDREYENTQIGLIMHSSGSTGLPKPVRVSHKALLTHAVQGAGVNNFGALPLYHMYGVSTTLQAMYMGKTANLFNSTLPLTADNLIAAIEAVRPQAIHSVPYALGLLAEKPKGVAYLRACDFVTSAGARTPDELGDRLVAEGVNLAVVFGTTEAGLLGDTMRRAPGDNTWNYVRIYANHRKFIYMDPQGDGSYECVYLKGHPGLSTSNSDTPAPGSWRSKDVFVPHPTIPDVWKYVTRIDDRVTLVNGEKVLPLPIEGRLREDPLIREAAVFGVDRPIPGLLVFRAVEGDHLDDEAYLDAIWPSVTDANARAEAFSQITREMIILVPSNVEYPRTDKGSIIRAQIYARWADQIDEAYKRLDGDEEGTLELDQAGIEEFILNTFRDTIGVALPSADADFFAAGIDSLKAIQMRRILQKTLKLGGHQLTPNVVYEKRNTRELAKYLYSLGHGIASSETDEDAGVLMKEMVAKYSNFSDTVLLTGATGSLGAHVLAAYARSHHVQRVFCLVRVGKGQDPLGRVQDSLRERGLELSEAEMSKVVALASDLAKPDFGLGKRVVEALRNEVSLIVHIAWAVNFNIPLASFEQDIKGVHNLVRFSMSVRRPEPAQLFFASSVSTAFETPGTNPVIPDGPINDYRHAASMGYGQSKWVGEHIVLNAARSGARAYNLRIGQIVGDADKGIWNDKEAMPCLIRSALTMKALPDIQGPINWLPVDTLANTILELSVHLSSQPRPAAIDAANPPVFYNLVNPTTFAWSDVLSELHNLGWDFETVSTDEWIRRLQKAADSADADAQRANPAVKLVDYFVDEYGGGEENNRSGLVYDTSAVVRDAISLREPPKIVEDGYVRKFVEAWLPRWTETSKPKVNGVNGKH